MRRLARLLPVVVAALVLFGAPSAAAQSPISATVTDIASGDTLTVRTAEGATLLVRLVGIRAPDVRDCGGAAARDALSELALGKAATLTPDPGSAGSDADGRASYYVDRHDGLDLGRMVVRAGWATVDEDPVFARQADYLEAEDAATGGVWRDCDGDFAFTPAEQRRALERSAQTFVRRYYRNLSTKRFARAWRMLGRPVRRKLGNHFRRWRASMRQTLGISVTSSRARIVRGRPIVAVRLRSRDRDVCSRAVVAQRFRGTVRLARRGSTFAIARFAIRKTAGKRPRLSKSECPKPPPPPGPPDPPPPPCQGYSPCLPPGPDVDCAGGSGDGPRYVQGPVYVNGSDPYGLDSDGDGVGCET